MKQIKLETSAGKTEIIIPGTTKLLREFLPPESTVVLADENYLRYHGDSFKDYKLVNLGSGEKVKSFESYHRVFGELLKNEVDRTWNLVGAGGGITTDLAGFVASTYFRGIPFSFLATTLLAQVDASIGGKNGINYEGFKNLMGVIRQPQFVFCDIKALHTLPKKEFIGGFAEIIKYVFIKRKDLYPYLEKNLEKALSFDEEILEQLVFESAFTKKSIVESDVHENADRKLLNFGHTFGHALEKLYGVSHGEGVAIGMMLAANLSMKIGLVDKSVPACLEELLIKSGLPVEMKFDKTAMIEAMKKDKKRQKDRIQFILLQDIGNAVIHSISVSELKNAFT